MAYRAHVQVTAAGDVDRCVLNCTSVATALGCHLPSSLLSLITFHTSTVALPAVVKSTSCMHAQFSHAEAEQACSEGGMLSGDTAGVFPGEEIGDSYRVVRAVGGSWTPLRLFVAVPALPKGCAVELQPLCAVATSAAVSRQNAVSDSDSDDGAEDDRSFQRRKGCPVGLPGPIFLPAFVKNAHACTGKVQSASSMLFRACNPP